MKAYQTSSLLLLTILLSTSVEPVLAGYNKLYSGANISGENWNYSDRNSDTNTDKTYSHIFKNKIDVTKFGVVGDGLTNDTKAFQQALNWCSDKETTCNIPTGTRILITAPVFIWGNSNLVAGINSKIFIGLKTPSDRYLLNLGMSAKKTPEKPFTGKILNVGFEIKKGPTKKGAIIGKKIIRNGPPVAGRIIKIWRSNGAEILNSTFSIGRFMYAAVGSGSNRDWLESGKYIRKNLLLSKNRIIASSDWHGMEGIGLTRYSNVLIDSNHIEGVGDDVVGLHKVKNVSITGNTFKGVDGRLLIASSSNILVKKNKFERIRSPENGVFYKGQALIYIGPLNRGNRKKPPSTYIVIDNNHFQYPDGASDSKGAIFLRKHDCVKIENNIFSNNSKVNISPAINFDTRKSLISAQNSETNSLLKNNKVSGKHPQILQYPDSNPLLSSNVIPPFPTGVISRNC